MRILALHGSPGSEKDFEFIKTSSELAPHKLEWVIPNRYKIDKNGNKTYSDLGEFDLVIAYSWGCAEYLLHAQEISTQNLLFISPFILGKKKTSPFMLFLMKLPFFAPSIRKGIRNFLRTSSTPRDIPVKYEAETSYFTQNLIAAMKEKREMNLGHFVDLRVKEKFFVIWGEEDNISFYQDQINPLIQHYPQIELTKIKSAGHALPWTHPKEIATNLSHLLNAMVSPEKKIE